MPIALTSTHQSDRDAAIDLVVEVTGNIFVSIPDYDPYIRAFAAHRERETGHLVTALKAAQFVIKSARPDSGALPLIAAAIARATGAGA